MLIEGFIWYRDIVDKLLWKHSVTHEEVEELFENKPKFKLIENVIWIQKREKAMRKNKRERESVPEEFDNIEAAAEFWDTHSLSDYEDLQKDVEFEVKLKSEKNYFAVEKELSYDIDKLAHLEGVLPETLVNLWLKEKVLEKRIQDKLEGW